MMMYVSVTSPAQRRNAVSHLVSHVAAQQARSRDDARHRPHQAPLHQLL